MLDNHDLFPTSAKQREIETGEHLFRRGDKTYAIFRVISGRLRLLRHSADSSTITLHVARSGEFFAEASLFSDHYHCDAVADVPTQISIYAKQPFLADLHNKPELATRFMALQAEQIQRLRTQIELRNIRSAKDRVLNYFRLLADSDGSISLDRPLKEMASDIGLSHEAFYRALRTLEQTKIISRSEKNLFLKT